MRRSRRAARFISIGCALIALTGCAVTYTLDRTWVEVQSEHFTITSDMRVEEAEKLARTLELFRASVLLITSAQSLDARIPTRVFFFRSEATFRSFQPPGGAGLVGYLSRQLRANFMTMVDSSDVDPERILRHEYVHFLVHNETSRIYPPWYDEGFAELLSTASRVGDYVAVGMVPEDRIRELRTTAWIPMQRILSYDGTGRWSARELSMFYAESWALLHFLSRDLEHAVALGHSVEIYLDQVESGASVEAAGQAAFGMSVAELDEQVRHYLTSGSFTPIGVRVDRLQWSEETHSRVLPRAVVAERLGELSLALGRTGHAESFFRAALAEDPGLARAYAGLGDILTSREQWSEAEQHFAKAVELAPDEPLNQLDYGEYWLARAERTEEPDLRRAHLERARSRLQRAVDLDEWKPEPWAVYGATFLVEGEDPSRGVPWLEQALRLLPSSPWIQLRLAEVYVDVDEKPKAKILLRRILSWSAESDPTAQKAHELMQQLESKGPTTDHPGSG